MDTIADHNIACLNCKRKTHIILSEVVLDGLMLVIHIA